MAAAIMNAVDKAVRRVHTDMILSLRLFPETSLTGPRPTNSPKCTTDASGGKPDLSQGRLQIEAQICRLLRVDRPVQRQDAASEHVIRCTVDGLDPDELPGFIAEGRERSLCGVAPHHNAIVAGGQAGNLQLVVALVAPE